MHIYKTGLFFLQTEVFWNSESDFLQAEVAFFINCQLFDFFEAEDLKLLYWIGKLLSEWEEAAGGGENTEISAKHIFQGGKRTKVPSSKYFLHI